MIRLGDPRQRCSDAFGFLAFCGLGTGVLGWARLSVLCSLAAIAAGVTFLAITVRSPR